MALTRPRSAHSAAPFRSGLALLFPALLVGCGPTSPPLSRPPPAAPAPDTPECTADVLALDTFSILIDGKEAGVEIRSRRLEPGPFGEEEVRLSHSLLRMRLGAAMIEHTVVRAERVLAASGRLLHASLVRQDQVSALVHLVGWDGAGWQRLVEKRGSVLDPVAAEPVPLEIDGDEVVGLALADALARFAAAGPGSAAPAGLSYYEPALDGPVRLTIGPAVPGRAEIDGQPVDAVMVPARRGDDEQPAMIALFDADGGLIEERYPALGEIRRRQPGPAAFSFDTSELLVGLRSSAYLGRPNAAQRAVFSLKMPEERRAVFEPLAAPVNQTVDDVAEGELLLEVRAGAPDGDHPPLAEDLGSCRYIQPKAPAIRAALLYLRSGGSRGSLPPPRAANATPVIARAALIAQPRVFWRDPDEVARLIMNYVSALLPDKRHTFSMLDAVSTLERGAGDCTEHAVLFASLMRAHGIPTRLVAGLYLTRGGLWGYHLWNAYWDGGRWRAIDPGNRVYRPGALYVAYNRGFSRFDDVRGDLGRFIDSTFRGVSFELAEAYGEGGELMILSRPRRIGDGLPETVIFNALVLAGRGDHLAALEALEGVAADITGTHNLSLMRIHLLVAAGRNDAALREIADLRRRTSASDSLHLLDMLEFEALLALGRGDDAALLLERLAARLADRPARLALLRSRLLRHTGAEERALALLRSAIADSPWDPLPRVAFARAVADLSGEPRADLLREALEHGREALLLTLSAEPAALAAVAALLVRAGRADEAAILVDHGLILAPAKRELLELRDRLQAERCVD